MLCKECNYENTENAKFCKSCGSPLEGTPMGNQSEVKESTTEEQKISVSKVDVGQLTDKIKALPKKTLAAAGAGVIVLIVLLCMLLKAPTIDLDKYLMIEATGYDGYGHVTASIDWDAVKAKYGDKIKYKSNHTLGTEHSIFTPMDILQYSIDVGLYNDSGMSNGDEISYTWNISSDIENYLNCKIKAEDGIYTVTGLQEIGVFDAFEDVVISFKGAVPNGYVEFEYTGELLEPYWFYYTPDNGLRNGDTVVVHLEHNEEYYASRFGMVPEKFEQEYVVEGLGEYITSYAEVDEYNKNIINEYAKIIINDYVATYDESSKLSEIEYEGYIFYDSDYYLGNRLYIVYSGTLSSSDGNFKTTKVYYPVKFDSILTVGDSISYSCSGEIMGLSTLDTYTWYTTKGYTSLKDMYYMIGGTNVEMSDSLKEFDK